MSLKTPSARLAALLGVLVAASALSACAPLLLGGAVVGGSMVAIDRRSSGAQVDDQAIELRGLKRVNETIGDRGSVSVTSYNRIVLITGSVTNEADKAAVERTMGSVESVRSIVNELSVGPASSFGNKSNDTFLTGKVKASLVDAKDLQANAFKVITERNIVYLMGRVTEREANRASDIARGVSGVAKVVKVFEIVTEAELNDLQTKTPPQAPPKP
ncbi:MAG TPA: BON domain-containing protein [Burkholderiaceae bacterium]|nr:BON domain-containing protein [Burkholderiaceae bacterium]